MQISLNAKEGSPEKSCISPRTNSGSVGRPNKSFAESCDRTKRRKTVELREEYSPEELAFAAKVSLRSAGAVSASKIIEDVTMRSPTRANKYRAAFQKFSEENRKISPDSALAILLNSKLTKQQYQNIRNDVTPLNNKILPTYQSVVEAKKMCYPSNITVSETRAEVQLQALLNHTCKRILIMQSEVLEQLDTKICENLCLIVKWGFDGSSGHKEYKQGFADKDNTDSSILLTSIVPIQLSGFDSRTGLDVIVWKNSKPSSSRFCRPIRIQFLPEDKKSTFCEKRDIDKQIRSLANFQFVLQEFESKKIQVSFKMTMTMIDGKVCNVITNTSSSMRCYVCEATSKEFNDIVKVQKRIVEQSSLQYGLSTLHCWIRFFECLLHVGYKLELGTWQARGKDAKLAIKNRKKNIQAAFKEQLHLLVDKPKQGMGNSNDGNTARRFFRETDVSARILGVDAILMRRFHVILQVLSSGFNVNLQSFKVYCLETAKMFVSLYPWYPMPTTVHKVLIHGHQIIETSILPIGQLSEEAQEARNKDVRNFREGFSRKCSREKTMEDIFLRLLATSDPLISSLKKAIPKRGKALFPEAIALLTYEKLKNNFGNSEIEDESSDEE